MDSVCILREANVGTPVATLALEAEHKLDTSHLRSRHLISIKRYAKLTYVVIAKYVLVKDNALRNG